MSAVKEIHYDVPATMDDLSPICAATFEIPDDDEIINVPAEDRVIYVTRA